MFEKNMFKDKIVMVSGGGSGIGKAMAKMFLTLGAKVYIGSRKKERLEEAMKELKPLGDCDFIELNIRETESVEQTAKLIKEKDGKLDILINNAGGQFPSPAEAITPKGWKAVIETNLNGTWFMTQTFGSQFFMPQKNGI